MMPGLRTAEQLVAGEGDERGAGVEALPHARFVAQPGGSLAQAMASCRRAAPSPRRRRPAVERRELRDRRRLDEPDHAVVRRVHLQQRARRRRSSARS